MVPIAVVPIAEDSAAALAAIVDLAAVPIAVVPIAEDSAAAALAAVVLSAEAHMVVVLTVADTAAADTAAVAAEWADADRSKHQLPHFRIRHPRNLAH